MCFLKAHAALGKAITSSRILPAWDKVFAIHSHWEQDVCS